MSRKSDDSSRLRSSSCKNGSSLYSKDKSTDMVSYEDLLIAQYLDELRRTKSEVRRTKDVPPSPYSLKLPHSDYGYHTKSRPFSATAPCRPQSGSKPKIDAKFIADPNLWDPATPRSSHDRSRKGRPVSAPVRRKCRQRPISGASNLSWFQNRVSYRPTSAFSGRKIKSQYRKQPSMIRVTALKNGSMDGFVRLAAPTMKVFLEMCTEKLQLPFAARRIFLEDGQEIFDARDIPIDGQVFVSTGENFKDPYKNVKRNMIISQGAKWTLSGVLIPEDGHIKTRTVKMSKRMKALTEKRRVRIIVYRNGMSTEPSEIVADLNKLDEFMVACTSKLNLRSHAKIVFDWEGNEISHLTQTPVLDDCLQPGGTAILGPVWISTGESFSATATLHYINSIRQVLTDRLKDAQRYKKEINFAMEGQNEKISITAILSMSEEELYDTCDLAEKEIKQLKDTLADLQTKISAIEEIKEKEEAEGSNYRMNHIQELPMDHKLVGTKGLRLKVYENGCASGEQTFFFNLSGALKGSSSNDRKERERQLQRLLDDLSTNRLLSNPVNPKLAPIAKKIFDQYGNEIKNILQLEYDQEIWVSFGEPYISPFTYCLQAVFDKASGFDLQEKVGIVREQLMSELIKDYKSHREFEAYAGFPPDYELTKFKANEEEGLKHAQDLTDLMGLSNMSHYMQAQKDKTLVLYPEIVVNQKLKKGHTSVWPTEAQVWVITKKGYIYCKAMPQLCLAVSDTRVEFNISDKADMLNGFVVNLQKVTRGNIYQQWNFNPDATMSPAAHPDLVMTYTGHKFGDEEGYTQPEGVSPGQKVYLIVTDRLPRKEASFQRFALKQERFENLGQWKHNNATNEEWRKLAYSWPVKEDGTLNEDYDWPMEAYILPNAPKLHKLPDKNKFSGLTPLRLMAVKNGERDIRKAIPVVGPNLTNMVKDMGKDKTGKSKHSKPAKESEGAEDDVVSQGKEELELIMFLDHCTSLLDLPFAARRLFDRKGNEHFNLALLKRDEIVYVSCGEPWTDPKLTRAEQQRRFLLSQLSQDVAKIRQYCALRNPENYVLEIEGNLTASNRLIVGQQWNSGQEDEDQDMLDTQSHVSLKSHTSGRSQKSSSGRSQASSKANFMTAPEFEYSQTAHEKSHEMSDQRLNNLKWPWERLVNIDQSNGPDDPEANKYSDREMYERYKPPPQPKISRDTLQRFVFEDGYIACAANRNLVLGVLEQEGRVSQVLLVKRRPDDINQRWIMRENGEIRSRHGQRSVVTVAMPANEPFAEDERGRPLTFKGCAVTVQQRKNNTYGKAHQRWRYDAETGFIHAFYTNRYDKEITAANKADVCTYSIADHTPIDQPGYMAEVPIATPTDRQNVKEIMVCTSCARAMRGRYKLQKLEEKTEFSCAMGEAKKLKLQQIGSFRVLNGKVDLSTHEAELTLQSWEDTLITLREETSVRVIAKELSVAKTVKTVKILAYKNGEGRLHPGELICGSSIEGLLGQCTHRLRLTNAAQRIFTEDGNLVLEVDDLVDWAVENYKTLMADQMERIMSGEGETKARSRKPGTLKSLQEENEEEEESYKTTWLISVVTSNQLNAGTDANVSLVVYGALGKSDTITLDNRDNNFERGKTDEFKIEMINIGKPYKIRAWHDNSGIAGGWKLDKIILENMDSKEVFTFPCNRWMALDEEDGSLMREMSAQGATIQNPLPLVRYAIEVYTGNMFKAGTNANVFINLYGQLGDTGNRPLKQSKSNKKKFERGMVDVFEFEAVTIGKLSKLIIWHDGTGERAGWYLDKVKVTQNGTDEFDTLFECQRWLSTEEEDGATLRELRAENEDENLSQAGEEGAQERGEGEGQDSQEEAPDADAAEVDQEESEKVAREREKLLENVNMPPLEVILRYPIEVWISSGKEFVPPEKVESKMESRMKKRAFRSSVSLELDIEKHVLRQMRARRMEDMSPGEYKSTRNSKQPVVIQGNWQEPTVEEQIKHDTVHKLETHLAEVKENQKEKQTKYSFGRNARLYKQPDTKRLMVYPNGESLERATYIWGDSIDSLLNSATMKLGLWQRAKYLYNMEGTLIVNFNDVNRDELLCVSTGKPFAKPHSALDTVEVKANWSRARKQYGPSATDFVVQASTNPKVDVDPFGPPELALPPQTENKPIKADDSPATK